MATMTVNLSTAGARSTRSSKSRTEAVAERNRDLFTQQRRAHRGPTPEIFFTKHLDNSRITTADDPVRKREMRIFSTMMSVLFVLVMVYVWQHFSSVELGYQIETQRTHVEELREGNRQLRLTAAQLSEPARIDRIARQLGLDSPQPGQVVGLDGTVAGSGAVMASLR